MPAAEPSHAAATAEAARHCSPFLHRWLGWWQTARRRLGGVGWRGAAGLAWVLVVVAAGPADAQPAPTSTVPGVPPIPDPDPALDAVMTNLRNVLVGLLAGLATLFLVVGGLRYVLAGSDPGQVEKAKGTLKYAAAGYAVAALAPVLVGILRGIVGA